MASPGLFSNIKESEAYTEAIAIAQQDPRVIEVLGEPIEPGFFLSGSVNFSGSTGEADIQIPLSGPKGSATLYVVAHRSAGEWEFERLEVDGMEFPRRVDLLDSDDSQRDVI